MATLPEEIQRAVSSHVDLFMGDGCEWKLDLAEQPEYVSALVGQPILVFANNGFGDYLFLKAGGDGYGPGIFEYFYEGPEIVRIDDELDLLLGLRARSASKDGYPMPIYEAGEKVQVDDLVTIKLWAQFWRGWQKGIITYVPGVSAMNRRREHGGLKWVVVELENGEVSPLVDPETGVVRSVRFVGRKTLG